MLVFGITSNVIVSDGVFASESVRGIQFCQASYHLPAQKWRMISLPCKPPSDANTVRDIFGDDISGSYGSDWVIYSYESNALASYKKQVLDSVLVQGKGYWIISTLDEVTLDFPQKSQQTPVSAACVSMTGCFDIPIVAGSSGSKWNLLGHPVLSPDTAISDLRVVTDTATSPNDCGDDTGCTMDEAEEDGVLHNRFWAYADSGVEGYFSLGGSDRLEAWMGVWAAALPGAAGKQPHLLIPIGHNTYPPSYFPDSKRYSSNWQPAPERNVLAPEFLNSIIDFDTQKSVWRLGGDDLEMGSKVSHPNGNGTIAEVNAQHFYSRTTVTNKNETFAIGAGRGGHAALWRLSDKQLVAWVPTAAFAADNQQWQILWDKNDSGVYWYTEGNKLKRVQLNLETLSVQNNEIWDTFPSYQYIAFGPGEGDFSDNGQRLVLAGSTSETTQNFDIISYEVELRKRVAIKPILASNDFILDWAGVDPSGQYVVFNRPSQGRSTWVLPFDLRGGERLLYRHMKHSDFVVDSQGESWLVFGHYQGVFATKLSDPLLKRVWPTAINVGNPANYPDAVINTFANFDLS